MCDRFSSLQNSDNRRLGLKLPVCSDALMGFLVLGLGLAGLNLVDLDAVLGVRKGGIDGEGVGRINVLAFGRFGEDAVVGAGEGLQGAL